MWNWDYVELLEGPAGCSTVAALSPPAVQEGSSFSTSSLVCFLSFFTIAILIGMKRYLTVFNLHFPDDCWCSFSFHVLMDHLCIFLGKTSIPVLCPFFGLACSSGLFRGLGCQWQIHCRSSAWCLELFPRVVAAFSGKQRREISLYHLAWTRSP